jgi:hypothetical protein
MIEDDDVLYGLCVIIEGGSAVLKYIFNQVVNDDD